jgi:hypothetical protein
MPFLGKSVLRNIYVIYLPHVNWILHIFHLPQNAGIV